MFNPDHRHGIWLASKPDNHCIRSLPWPIVFIGILFLFLAFTGFVGAHWNKPGLLSFYLFCNAALIVTESSSSCSRSSSPTLRARTRFPAGVRRVPLHGLLGVAAGSYHGPENWGSIRACLASSSICNEMVRESYTAPQFFSAHISSLQSGCCKPPTVCGYQYVNPITWINPTNPMADVDCIIWNNDPNQLCYNCDSCKAGVLGNLRKEWKEANVILIVAVLALICLYLVAFNAYKNSQTPPKK
ncbi:hypothetical protein OSB04_020446 [Centaurea solstitialis]|uniref:Uncharacterized protein n=1 Tax=Centaurea solstitialis TaxID=347529 RepID=A0AA38SSP1_9ASTR|nr:hypothetical protein OSB04_020446 [Centaurea solstitialis]